MKKLMLPKWKLPKWKLLVAVAVLAVCAANVAFAAGYVKDFSAEYDEPLCIAQTDYVTVEVNGIEVEDDYLVIDTLVANSSRKRGCEVSVTRASVNGIELYPTYSEDVDAEDECDEPIELDLSDVIANTDLHDISDIELAIVIEDDDMEVVYKDTVHIYPHGADKAERYARPAADTDIVVVDTEKFTVTVTEFEYVAGWGYSVHMFLQNKTDAVIWVEGQDFVLNGTDADTQYDRYVGARGVCFSRLEWSQADLDDAEAEEVTSITFNLNIYDEAADTLLYVKTIRLDP